MSEDRREESLYGVTPAQQVRDAHITPHEGQDREYHQRDRHHPGRLVDVMLHLLRGPAFAVKGAEKEAEHVKGGHPRRHRAEEPDPQIAVGRAEGLPEDFILAEKAGEARYPGDGQAGDEERPIGDGGFLP